MKAATDPQQSRLAQAFWRALLARRARHLSRYTVQPRPHHWLLATLDEIASLGIVSARAQSDQGTGRVLRLRSAALQWRGKSGRGAAAVAALEGVGPWTASYIAMRALRWPDAFPKEGHSDPQ